jgi:hypothetical protein
VPQPEPTTETEPDPDVKYLCMAWEEEAAFAALSPEEWRSLRADTLAYVEELMASGVLLDARPLRSATTAVTVRVRDDRLSVVDGPFAESKEQIGGYFLIEVRDRDEALAVAARWPGARIGHIEVRPVDEELREDRRY